MTRTPNPVAPPGEPFATVEELVFWAVPALIARHEGVRIVAGRGVARPCEPVDFQVVVNSLLRERKLVAMHLRTLFRFGQLGFPPDPLAGDAARYVTWWHEALDRLRTPLVAKGIVVAQQRGQGQ